MRFRPNFGSSRQSESFPFSKKKTFFFVKNLFILFQIFVAAANGNRCPPSPCHSPPIKAQVVSEFARHWLAWVRFGCNRLGWVRFAKCSLGWVRLGCTVLGWVRFGKFRLGSVRIG